MRTIAHRELRNNSSKILEAVRNGESFEITNHGVVVAVLSPPSLTPYERLLAEGKVQRGTQERNFSRFKPALADRDPGDVLNEMRGQRDLMFDE
ncbi:type II toxin-antitoxin system prevent-host-death family antitoxin [Gordonia pseudamarae]|jgi:prevent-host-death family protein|uniref:Antitoxin n=1 Tax=Gordonia pseudamarae TaxID=2831662 RepID=A0ABX6IM28_9ACTN|nr:MULTISPECIES: type II toxin-antitoxin system prevent-host-death family antitoxin [Gordonia]MBD0023815.1 type II toxin-antitoxin system prevent-host-death family antitoxin [Gordonia sp. (in: high G+C Gram-positive bacteria)]QHN28119.1 type II toxin-antitoxin system prevent-host-death family antitoxin [Gordonia pseudamarae]QHN36982.1 type II toxin-antitoxin system prevent-host-death family antitoxin [Gordonia pseudamarae]